MCHDRPDQPHQPPEKFPFRITFERRLLAPDAEWAPIFRLADHPGGYGVNLRPAAQSLVLGRHPEWDRGVVHLRLELHQSAAEAAVAADTARAHFRALGYADTTTRVEGIEIEEAAVEGLDAPLAAIAMLAVVRHPQEKLLPGAALPWISRRDRREGQRHTVVGLTHELYLTLAEVNDCLGTPNDGQIRQWRFGTVGPPVFAREPVTISRPRPGRLRVSVRYICLRDNWAQARFQELVAALRCHPAVWDVGVTTDAEAGVAELDALASFGFKNLNLEASDDGEIRRWGLNLRD